MPEVGLGGFKVLEDPHSNYTCTGGWQPTVNCDPFAVVNVDGVLGCDEPVPPKLSGYCQCSHGLIARRWAADCAAPVCAAPVPCFESPAASDAEMRLRSTDMLLGPHLTGLLRLAERGALALRGWSSPAPTNVTI